MTKLYYVMMKSPYIMRKVKRHPILAKFTTKIYEIDKGDNFEYEFQGKIYKTIDELIIDIENNYSTLHY